MVDTRTLKEKSFQNNLDKFIKDITDLELYQLVNYLNSKFGDEPANELQSKFIDEFFGYEEWAIFLNDSKKENSYILSIEYIHCSETLKKIREYMLFRMSHRFLDLLADKNKIECELTNLKLINVNEKLDNANKSLVNSIKSFNDNKIKKN